MNRVVVGLLMLTSCGASTTTSTGAPIAGTYRMTATLNDDGCGGCPSGQGTINWSIAPTDKGWLLTRGDQSGPATQSGDTLTFSQDTPTSSAGCSLTIGVAGSLVITTPGFSGHMDVTFTPPCDGSPRASCQCKYALTATRQ